MARSITPERQELRAEAIRLRKAGWNEREISKALAVPPPTIHRWIMEQKETNTSAPQSILEQHSRDRIAQNNPSPITLFPCKYEEVGTGITPASVDLILTDPPYLASSNNLSRTLQKTDLRRDYGKWDKIPARQYAHSVGVWASLMAQHLKEGGALYCFMALRQLSLWCDAFERGGLTYQNFIIWHRANPAPQMRQTKWCHAFDSILYFTKGSPKTFRWFGLNNMHNVIKGPICQGGERTYHPTQKPRWLLRRLLMVSSRSGDTILDPFSGSGATAFSGHNLDHRKYILIEPDPQYAGLIRGRAKEEFDWDVRVHG